MHHRLLLVGLGFAAFVAGCGSESSAVENVSLADGFALEVMVDGLVGPTQFSVDDDHVLVAMINGGENDKQGQVIDIDLESGERVVVVDELDKPTGLALVGDDLWIMERDSLSHLDVRLGEPRVEGRPRVVLRNLPNNGRSEGALTTTPDGQLLFDTSGSKRGAQVVEGSGRLFTLDIANILDTDPSQWSDAPVEIASGFKHAYAHVYDNTGSGTVLWATEMTDGRFDDEPAGDEIVQVVIGADHGWPWCVENNRPVIEFGGTPDECAAAPESLAVFAPGASPTSVVVSPFGANTLLVALWNEDRVVAVDTSSDDPTAFTDVVTGVLGPYHLEVVGDAVIMSELGTGRLLRLTGTN